MNITGNNDTLLENIATFNLVVGRNGSGKSRFLRELHSVIRNRPQFRSELVNPERGGHLHQDGNIEDALRQPTWIYDTRNRNQSNQFKQSARARLKNTHQSFLLKLERDRCLRDSDKTFASEYIEDINSLLHNVRVVISGLDLTFETVTGAAVDPEQLSSGESEVIALASEVLWFLEQVEDNATNIMFVDEPDVHLHPDLQARLARFFYRRWHRLSAPQQVLTHFVIATHSTPLLAAFAQLPGSSIGVKQFDTNIVTLSACSELISKTLPFIAHPLSSVFNLDQPLIVEGDDDERVWAQVSKSSKGKIRLFPCVCDTVDKQTELERFLGSMLRAVYDEPSAISVRDGDGKTEPLQHEGCVKRYRLACYAIENLLLTDEVLGKLGHTWESFCVAAQAWVEANSEHRSRVSIQALVASHDRMRHAKIKDLRALILAICGREKSVWEVVIGQAIAALEYRTSSEHSLANYLGDGLISGIGLTLAPLPLTDPRA